MADRYWVGGTGTWNTTSTTNWSATSGGGSGASVPTVADNVFFDQAGTYTVTMTGALACLDITVSAGTVTFADGTSPTLQVRGSMSLLAGTVWSFVGGITFTSTTTGRTITTNGVSFSSASISFSGVGGVWTLGSALTATNATLSISFGTLDTSSVGNYAVTCSTFAGGGINARTVNFNNSTITCTGNSANAINLGVITNLTFNAGTSQINLSGTTSGINSGGLTFYNVAFTSTATGTKTIAGINTFNNLSVTGPASAGVVNVTFAAQQTINGTLSTTGTAGNRRVFFTTATYGISYDLVVNSAPSLTDADFRGLYVRGTAAPISGTRIGNRGECRGITFSTPKTVYWNLGGSNNWNANAWAANSGGALSTDNFPLPQDTAIVDNANPSVGNTISMGTTAGYLPTVDFSSRTLGLTFSPNAPVSVYGNWTNGSGISISVGSSTLTFSGGTTQTITSAGKTFSCPITVDTYGGTVQLADALNIGSNNFTVTNGTFNTAGYAVNIGNLSSSNSNVRTINLGASTVTIINTVFPISLSAVNLSFNAGTSTIAITYNTQGFGTVNLAGVTFYNFNFLNTNSNEYNLTFSGVTSTFNNLSFSFPNGTILAVVFQDNHIINGTLTCAGASAIRRVFLSSSVIGTPRTLTVNAISADDCDFRDITLAGAASGASPTRAGDCGGNTGITFPAPKTVYWNLAGTQNWSATGWATSSGGTPAVNNFPLAQDTVVFDNSGAIGTIRINGPWNIGAFDASLRTSSMTIDGTFKLPVVYGDWKSGTGLTWVVDSSLFTFAKNGTQTITSNGVQFGCDLAVNHPLANVQLADALSLNSARRLTLSAGTFDAVTYNVTTGLFTNNDNNTLRMGSGTWTLAGTGTVWAINSSSTLIAGTSTIVLSNTSTSARTFAGGGLYYNKLTIGGATGTSTLTITGNNTFGELASTKTVAHTITFSGSSSQTIGKWSVTGTVGNVVTVNSSNPGTAFTLSIAGPANSGIDYLSVRDCTVSAFSPGEFYVGANSTNVSNNTRVIFTAAPAPRTLYWVGGTGNWSSTTKWDTTSGGGGGAAIPTSLDAVNFNSASNATAYTATIDAGVTTARCASFTVAGPLSGNVTLAGTSTLVAHGNFTTAATGVANSYAGVLYLTGASGGSYVLNTNGVSMLSADIIFTGIGSSWTLASAVTIGPGKGFQVTYGAVDTAGYTVTSARISVVGTSAKSLSLGSSNIICNTVGFSIASSVNLTFNAGTSTITQGNNTTLFTSPGLTFYNVVLDPTAGSIAVTGANTFNTLSFAGRTSLGIATATFNANQTVGTLTLNAGTASAYRTLLASDTIGTQRTLNVTTLTAGAADIDFRDIAITGAAAPLTGTRFGDAKGNSGITFPAAKTVYYRQTGSSNWGATGTGSWSATSGGSADATQFPLAQDTAVFPAATYPSSGATTTVNASYNIGTIDMSLRTTNTMTLATGATTPQIYGNWINGTGTTLSGTGRMTFAGRSSQAITSAGKTFGQPFTIDTPNGSVTLQDALVIAPSTTTGLTLNAGIFDAATYNITLASTFGASFGQFVSASGFTRTIAVGNGTWTFQATGGPWFVSTTTGLNVTGSGIINMTGASAKTFTGGGISYSGITLNQGGAGALTILGNNTFKDITNTYSATGATTIALGNTTQTVTQWSGVGEAGRLLTLSGTSAASPATLIISGSVDSSTDYLNISNVRGYPVASTWFIGANSTNSGSLGFLFEASGGTVYNVTIIEAAQGLDAFLAFLPINCLIAESVQTVDQTSAQADLNAAAAETSQASDQAAAQADLNAAAAESAQASDAASATAVLFGSISDAATGQDTAVAFVILPVSVAEAAQALDQVSGGLLFAANISELVTGLDSVSAQATLNASAAETAQGLDQTAVAASSFSAQASETSTASDAQSAAATFPASLAEQAQIQDSTAAALVVSGSVSEIATAIDSLLAGSGFFVNVTEQATALDAQSAAAAVFGVVSETAQSSDSAATVVVFVGAVAEQLSSSELLSVAASIFNAAAQDQAQAQDSVNAPGSTYNPTASETAQAQDQAAAAATFPVAVADSANISDADAAAFTAATNISESAQASEIASALAAFAALTAESAAAADQTSVAPSVFSAIAAASARALDSLNAPGSVYSASVADSVTILDSLVGAYLWNLINDSESTNWQNVGNTQGSVWTPVNTDEDPDWQTIPQP